MNKKKYTIIIHRHFMYSDEIDAISYDHGLFEAHLVSELGNLVYLEYEIKERGGQDNEENHEK